MRISESPRIPALVFHLISRVLKYINSLWSIVLLIVSWEENSYLRLEEGSPRTKGGGRRDWWGPNFIRSGQSGQLYGQGRYGSTRLQWLGPRISSYVWFAGAA